MTKMQELAGLGQAIWFDYISRSLIESGKLKKLVDEGLRGVTSNPSIFEKAIAGSADYDVELGKLVKDGKSVDEVYEALAFRDISDAADVLRPVYDATSSVDGYVSLEVNPSLANDTEGTITEARRLFKSLSKPNVMIKVPATRAGFPAIETLISEGINVNVTLIFSLDHYGQAARAYVAGLEKLATNGGDVSKVASVASFFVSRVDTAVDKELSAKGKSDLLGKAAVANSKLAYALFKETFNGEQWNSLTSKGAHVQRVLWASTSTKNPDYKDTLYVDELIGPDTVNTLPPNTLDAFVDHGAIAQTLEQDVDESKSHMDKLKDLGIDMEVVTENLQIDGVAAFAKSFDALMASIADKREKLLSS